MKTFTTPADAGSHASGAGFTHGSYFNVNRAIRVYEVMIRAGGGSANHKVSLWNKATGTRYWSDLGTFSVSVEDNWFPVKGGIEIQAGDTFLTFYHASSIAQPSDWTASPVAQTVGGVTFTPNRQVFRKSGDAMPDALDAAFKGIVLALKWEYPIRSRRGYESLTMGRRGRGLFTTFITF